MDLAAVQKNLSQFSKLGLGFNVRRTGTAGIHDSGVLHAPETLIPILGLDMSPFASSQSSRWMGDHFVAARLGSRAQIRVQVR